MLNKLKKLIFIITLLLFQTNLFSQINIDKTAKVLDSLSKNQKGLNDIMQSNANNVKLFDFINAIGYEHKINLVPDSNLTDIIYNNFYNLKVKNVLLFLAKKYNLQIKPIKNIITITKRKDKKTLKPKKSRIFIKYDSISKLLTLKVNADTLYKVTNKIIDYTHENIILSPKIKNKLISIYAINQSLEKMLEMLAKSNGLQYSINKNGYFYIDNQVEKVENKGEKKKQRKRILKHDIEGLTIKVNSNNKLDIKADNISLSDLIYNAAIKSDSEYLLYTDIDKNLKTTFYLKNISFEDLLRYIFVNTKYTFKKINKYYLIGIKDKEGLRDTELIQLNNRTIESVKASIPKNITNGLEINEFPELNGLIVSGDKRAILELKNYINTIDLNVPMVQIEILIVEYDKSYDYKIGLKAGVNNKAKANLTSLYPTTDVTLNSNMVNEIIDAFNGLGIFNLGKVTRDFYLNLQAMENNSIINIESTPKIATLNGHEATFTIGSTDYYFEQQNRLITQGVNNNVLQSGQWKPTEANLSITIKPFVSKDEDVTLDITVEKSSFTGKKAESAPPGKKTQKFKSMIRVKNGDMILLGGLDEAQKSNTGSGVPFLSRIPVIKWLFSGRQKKKSKSKLHIFIKPTVYYQ